MALRTLFLLGRYFQSLIFSVALFIALGSLLPSSANAVMVFYGKVVKDYDTGLLWTRCSVGQRWTGSMCAGNPAAISYKVAQEVAKKAQLESYNWRIPTRKELVSIACKNCPGVRIDKRAFPATPNASYWTSTRNFWRSQFMWSVNFANGNPYAQNPTNARLYLRLVTSNNNIDHNKKKKRPVK